MAFAPAAKVYKTWRGTTTVTVQIINKAGDTFVEVTALQEQADRNHQVFGSVALEGEASTWLVPNDQLGGKSIRRGDRIHVAEFEDVDPKLSDQERWRVVSAQQVFWGGVWRCICSKEA